MSLQNVVDKPTEIFGVTTADLSEALSRMEDSLEEGGRASLILLSTINPGTDVMDEFYRALLASGFHVTRPTITAEGDLFLVSFVLTKGSPVLLALIPIIPTILILGLVGFGLFRIESIAKALIPISIIAFGGVIVLAAVLTRPPVLQAAQTGLKEYRRAR